MIAPASLLVWLMIRNTDRLSCPVLDCDSADGRTVVIAALTRSEARIRLPKPDGSNQLSAVPRHISNEVSFSLRLTPRSKPSLRPASPVTARVVQGIAASMRYPQLRSEEHTSEVQPLMQLVLRLPL